MINKNIIDDNNIDNNIDSNIDSNIDTIIHVLNHIFSYILDLVVLFNYINIQNLQQSSIPYYLKIMVYHIHLIN